MAKIQSFADKMSKDKSAFLKRCPKCGETIMTVKLVASELSEKTNAYRFMQSFVGVCKCNENNIMEPIVRGQTPKVELIQSGGVEPDVKVQPEEAKPSETVDQEPAAVDQPEEVKAPESGGAEPKAEG